MGLQATFRLIHESIPGNIGPGRDVLRRVELLAEDYDRYRTREREIERILERAGIPEGGTLSARVEALRVREAAR